MRLSMKPKLQENPREWQKFTAACAVVLFLIGFVLQKRGVLPGRLWMVLIAAAVPVGVCLMKPVWFRVFYRLGMTASFFVGQIAGRVLLVVFFLAILTPMAWLLRLLGKDLLNLKPDAQATSYWRPAKTGVHLDRLF